MSETEDTTHTNICPGVLAKVTVSFCAVRVRNRSYRMKIILRDVVVINDSLALVGRSTSSLVVLLIQCCPGC